jgi:hypothetical protein
MDEIVLKLIIDGLDLYGINPEAKESFKRMIKNYGDLRFYAGELEGELKHILKHKINSNENK